MYVLILVLDLFLRLIFFLLIINACRRTHIYSKNYDILTKSTNWKWKTSSSIKSNSITRIAIFINIYVFFKVTANKKCFYCRIAIVRTRRTKFIGNINVYYFSMRICNFCLFYTISSKFYSYFGTIIT